MAEANRIGKDCPICQTREYAVLLSTLPGELCEWHRALRKRWLSAHRSLLVPEHLRRLQ